MNKFQYRLLALSLLVTLAFSASAENHTSRLDKELRALTQQLKLTGSPQTESEIPSIHSPIAQLGMQLFYTKLLGGEKDVACASCHHPLLGGGDNLSLPIGTHAQKPDVLGLKRKLKKGFELGVPRNAPTTFNIAFYKKSLFHDGRVQTINNQHYAGINTPDVPLDIDDPLGGNNLPQAQARFPVTSAAEMRGDFMPEAGTETVRRALANRLKANWLEAFRYGFSDARGTVDDLITEQNISAAIGEYERSQVFINNPWKRYLEGDDKAISTAAKKGALLFFNTQDKGGANCNRCHSGDFFTDESFHNTAMPQIGPGKGEGLTKTNDFGCGSVSNKANDKFRFRTPSLLNVEVTGPWGHDGAYTTLEGITRHMLSPMKSIRQYNKKQLKQKNISVKDIKKNTLKAAKYGLELNTIKKISNTDVRNLVEFLKTLTDPCVKSEKCLSPWIPNKHDNDPDGLTLHAVLK